MRLRVEPRPGLLACLLVAAAAACQGSSRSPVDARQPGDVDVVQPGTADVSDRDGADPSGRRADISDRADISEPVEVLQPSGAAPLLCPACRSDAGGDTSDFNGVSVPTRRGPPYGAPGCNVELRGDPITLDAARDLGFNVWHHSSLTREFEASVRWRHADDPATVATLRFEHPGTVTLVHAEAAELDPGSSCVPWVEEVVTVTMHTADGAMHASFDALLQNRIVSYVGSLDDLGPGWNYSGDVSASARGSLELDVDPSAQVSLRMLIDLGPRLPGLDTRMSLALYLVRHEPLVDMQGVAQQILQSYQADPADGCSLYQFSPDLFPDFVQYANLRNCTASGRDGIRCCAHRDEIVLNGFRIPDTLSEPDGGS